MKCREAYAALLAGLLFRKQLHELGLLIASSRILLASCFPDSEVPT